MTIPSGNANWSGSGITRKVIEEIKNGERILYSGNILENVDNSGGQSGVQADFNVQNWLLNYQLSMNDITFENNLVRNSCEGFEVDGSNASNSNGGGIAYPFKRGWWNNNLFYNTSASNPGCSGVNGTNIETSAAKFQWQGTVTENSNGTATFVANCAVNGGPTGKTGGTCPGQIIGGTVTSAGTGCVAGNLTIGPPNIVGGIQATGTYSCSSGGLSGITITNNGSGYTSVPAATIATGTGTLTLTLQTTASEPGQGEQVMDVSAGDSIAVTMCQSVSGFNVPTATYGSGIGLQPSGIGPVVTAGSVTWNGTYNSANTTVTYGWTGVAAGTTDNSGYCTLSNLSGNPQDVYMTHNTFISDSKSVMNSGDFSTGPNFSMNREIQNNIFVVGIGGTTLGWDNDLGEGTPTETFNYDYTSMTADHNVFPGRNGSLYTAYCNNPAFPCASPVMYFPAAPYCTGATSTSSCVGFVGAMNAASMPLTLPDYHQFELRSDSLFYAGGAEGASDGTSMGANIPAIDGAQTETIYVCRATCGSGPFHD